MDNPGPEYASPEDRGFIPRYRATCQCGAVAYEVCADPVDAKVCHCRDCQKFTASAFSLTTMVPRDGFSCDGEVTFGGLKRDGRAHYFCASCLNFVFSQIGEDSPRVNVRTSLLKAAARFEPFIEIMTEEQMPWAKTPAKHSYARYPETVEELQDLFDAYRATL